MTQTTMKDITDKQLIAEFKERFCVPNFFSKKHVEEIQGNITDEQWEKFKDDYNSNAAVHSVASEDFAHDVECLFYESEIESESEDEDEETKYCYANGKHSAPIPCGCPQPCCVPEEDG